MGPTSYPGLAGNITGMTSRGKRRQRAAIQTFQAPPVHRRYNISGAPQAFFSRRRQTKCGVYPQNHVFTIDFGFSSIFQDASDDPVSGLWF